MKYKTLPAFDADFKRLSDREQRLFRESVHRMIDACRREPGRVPPWPASLRVRPMADHPGIYEMTWSFAGPDGRATFEIMWEGGEPILRWRRIGDHRIFREP